MVVEDWDWNRMITSSTFYELVAKGFPKWQKIYDDEPANIILTIVRGTDRDSRDIAIEVDDWCEGKFWYRDFTENGLPFIDNGEKYAAKFYFQYMSDAAEFRKLYGGC